MDEEDSGTALSSVGATGTPTAVWKYRGCVNDEHPALLHAATFHRYCLPSTREAVYEVLATCLSTTKVLL
ncbi:MAG: hypothetical protein LC667_09615, partial [Thioalkalivibrio sp.]|nr:hypothetical protein [Thioalkalivibrio sp.]